MIRSEEEDKTEMKKRESGPIGTFKSKIEGRDPARKELFQIKPASGRGGNRRNFRGGKDSA